VFLLALGVEGLLGWGDAEREKIRETILNGYRTVKFS